MFGYISAVDERASAVQMELSPIVITSGIVPTVGIRAVSARKSGSGRGGTHAPLKFLRAMPNFLPFLNFP